MAANDEGDQRSSKYQDVNISQGFKRTPNLSMSTLNRKRHIDKLIEGLTGELSKQFEKIVPAQTWTVYWISHSLALLEQTHFIETVREDVVEFMKECAHEEGGYGGGPGQIAHLAATFAAINALICVSSDGAMDSIDRVNLVRFLHRMKQPDGAFAMHDDGEIDSRATYCALSVLRCLNIHDELLLNNVADWILSCQTYEGGFASVPGSEAHGGYTFCCVASLCLMNQLHRADINSLLRWLTNRQLELDGGFCGRSNKLVDSCYSYWQGAVFPLIHSHLKHIAKSSSSRQQQTPSSKSSPPSFKSSSSSESMSRQDDEPMDELPSRRMTRSGSRDLERDHQIDNLLNNWLFDCAALQEYVLNQCQARTGLLKDKPSTIPDFYHTCYALSGLSISQHQPDDSIFDIGSQPINILAPIQPLFNLTFDNLNHCFDYFKNKSIQIYRDEKKMDDE